MSEEKCVFFGFWWGLWRWSTDLVDGKWGNGPKRTVIFSGCLEVFSVALTLFYSSVNFSK